MYLVLGDGQVQNARRRLVRLPVVDTPLEVKGMEGQEVAYLRHQNPYNSCKVPTSCRTQVSSVHSPRACVFGHPKRGRRCPVVLRLPTQSCSDLCTSINQQNHTTSQHFWSWYTYGSDDISTNLVMVHTWLRRQSAPMVVVYEGKCTSDHHLPLELVASMALRSKCVHRPINYIFPHAFTLQHLTQVAKETRDDAPSCGS